MRLHIISTINGLQNEGMRNVATHLSDEFEKEHTVTYSGLRDVFSTIKNGRKSDVTLVFARLIKPVFYLLRVLKPFLKKVCVVCVQPVCDDFLSLNKKHSVVDRCFTLCKEDVKDAFDDSIVHELSVGINTEKFKVDTKNIDKLKKELNLPQDKTIVLHVGHCSSGRGLQDLLALDKSKYHSVVIASGMFTDEKVKSDLIEGGVDLRLGFVENIEDYYNCADVYFFPTKSSEFVISVPLSCMEALSCGTPVVAYKSFDKITRIKVNSENAIMLINSLKELNDAIETTKSSKSDTSYLYNPKTWQEVGTEVLAVLKNMVE